MRRNTARIYSEYLVASARTGDKAAFRNLASHWQPRFMAHAYRLTGDADLALDVTQDAWIHIVRGLPKLKDVGSFQAWAYRIVTRRAADTIRQKQRQRRTTSALAVEPLPDEHSASDVEAFADRRPLLAAMAKLSAEQRAAVSLFYIEDLSIAEISAALGVPAGTVKTRLMHARKNLRAALEGENNG